MAAGRPYALRFVETDTVLGRKDMPAGYHIAVVVDDAVQGVTLVTRGEDLAFARPLHERLQVLLGLPTPAYEHHRILTDADGRRFAKRDKSQTLAALREAGATPADIRRAHTERPEGIGAVNDGGGPVIPYPCSTAPGQREAAPSRRPRRTACVRMGAPRLRRLRLGPVTIPGHEHPRPIRMVPDGAGEGSGAGHRAPASRRTAGNLRLGTGSMNILIT